MDHPFKADFARNIAEARSVLAYMRAVADKDHACRDDARKSIAESWALLKKLPGEE